VVILTLIGVFAYKKYDNYKFEKNALYEFGFKQTCLENNGNEEQCLCAFDKLIKEHGLNNYKEFIRILYVTQEATEKTEEIKEMEKQVNGWINAMNRYTSECKQRQ